MELTSSEGLGIDDNLEELRRQGLVALCVLALFLSWAWIVVAGVVYGQPVRLSPMAPAVLLMASSSACLIASGLPVRWRSMLFIAGITCASVLCAHTWGVTSAWLYYQSLIVGIAAVLAGSRVQSVLALLLTITAVLLARYGSTSFPFVELLSGLGLLWSTTATSWLATDSLYTALAWALVSQDRAWWTADEARERRGELRRILDSLKVTHGLLERTTLELDAARREAEEARQVKSRFVANISHELRTPLNIIVGFAEMLCTLPESYGDFSCPPKVREDLLTIWRNAEHLLQMVDDVLDLAQVEAGRLPVIPEPTDVLGLIHETLAMVSALLKDSRLDLRIALPEQLPALNLDRGRIRQVLLNLVNNAVRHTRQGVIEVGAYIAESEVVIYVRDSGEGIPPDKLEVIFQEFEQVDTSVRRPHQGAGLGLAICRQFVRLHGGRVWAESELGNGSTFYISLPFEEEGRTAPAGLQRTRPVALAQPQERTVVALCRDPFAVRMLGRQSEGVQVLLARSVDEAAKLVRDEHPQVMLVAPDAADSLSRATAEAHSLLSAVAPLDIPVIVCELPTERRAGRALGVSEFLIKPIVKEELVAAVGRLCPNPQRVLAVDDEPDMRRLLARMVAQRWPEAEVLAAASGEQALDMLASPVDAILLDLGLPGMSGVEVLKALRSDPSKAHIPVIVITASGLAHNLTGSTRGEMLVLRNVSLSAGELVRVTASLAESVPPHYVSRATDAQGIPGAALVGLASADRHPRPAT